MRYDLSRGGDGLAVRSLSTLDLQAQVGSDGATWLDRELVSRNRTPLAGAGFGRDVADAMERRKQALVDMGHATRLPDGGIRTPADLLSRLERAEMTRVGRAMAFASPAGAMELRTGDKVHLNYGAVLACQTVEKLLEIYRIAKEDSEHISASDDDDLKHYEQSEAGRELSSMANLMVLGDQAPCRILRMGDLLTLEDRGILNPVECARPIGERASWSWINEIAFCRWAYVCCIMFCEPRIR
jgi:hypothetical protein